MGGIRVAIRHRNKARSVCTAPNKGGGSRKGGPKKLKRVRPRRIEKEKTHFQVLGWGRRIWGRG